MRKINDSIKGILVLALICFAVAISLAAVNNITAPIIESAQNEKANEALYAVMSGAEGFDELSLDALPETVTSAYKESSGMGYVFELTVNSYNPGLVIICGIGADGSITGCTTLVNNDSPGYGQRASEEWYTSQYAGKTTDTLGEVMPISGATVTSMSYKKAIKDAFEAFNTLSANE